MISISLFSHPNGLQWGQGERRERAVGSEVLSQQGLDQLQSDRGEVPLPHERDSLAQVLGLVRAHRVDGGEDEDVVVAEGLATDIAAVGLFFGVSPFVDLELLTAAEPFVADATDVRCGTTSPLRLHDHRNDQSQF